MDHRSLQLLGSEGIGPVSLANLSDIAEWCWDYGEANADARYLVIWRVLNDVEASWSEHEALSAALVERLNRAFARWISDIVAAPDIQTGTVFAAQLRGDITAAFRER